MLHWVGKKPLERLPVFPAQKVEEFVPKSAEKDQPNLLFHGDNKEVLAWLLANGYRGEVDLIYIDPPFDSGADYVRRAQLRGSKNGKEIEGEEYTVSEQVQYTDIWSNDGYLQFMYERLQLLRSLLSKNGSMYLHCDYRRSHHLRTLLDEVFGPESIISEVIWHYSGAGVPGDRWASRHDTIFWCAGGERWTFNPDPVRTEYAEATKERFKHTIRNVRGEQDFGSQQLNPLGKYPEDVLDISIEAPSATARTGYPTQKPDVLLEKLILASSNKGDVVLDCFIGSGTTAAVAQRLGRRWIGCDINKGAIQTTSKRLQTIIREQMGQCEGKLVEEEIKPASRSFAVLRVNDYDLQIQHNEALQLAIEHVGITRTKADPFFEGTLGTELVKVVPLQHPCTLLDLQLIEDEIKRNRKDEDRNIVIVCLGKEAAVDAWIERHNKTHPVNKMRVIELRTDRRYGKFFEHKPCRAEVNIRREGRKLTVEIKDFLSPTIHERISSDEGVLQVKIDDWRAQVDTVLIDTDYDSKVFRIAHSDVPKKKTDLVEGRYTLELPIAKKRTVAVKIIDMLGEEVLVTKEV